MRDPPEGGIPSTCSADFFVCGKGGNEVFLLFFLLWLLLSGGVSLHACLWGLAVSALPHLVLQAGAGI